MKNILLVISLIIIGTNASSAHGMNNDTKVSSDIIFRDVKTQTINVGGIDFYYRKAW